MIQPVQLSNAAPGWEGNEYASVNCFNDEENLILTIAQDHFKIRNIGISSELSRDLPIPASAEPRWYRRSPSLLLYIRGNQVRRYDVNDGSDVALHTFTEYSTISGCGEADISADGRHIVLLGDSSDVFVYDFIRDVKGQVFKSAVAIDGLKITLDNQPVWSNANGIFTAYDADGARKVRQLTMTNGHAAIGKDADGSGVLIWTNNQDNGIYKVPLNGGPKQWLYQPPWPVAVDISMSDDPAFCLVSEYSLDARFPGRAVKVRLDGSGAEPVCPTGSVQIQLPPPAEEGAMYYNPQPKASLSRSGRRFVFSSNNGKTADPNYCETWLGVFDASVVTPAPEWTTIDYSAPGLDKTRYRFEYEVQGGKLVLVSVQQKGKS